MKTPYEILGISSLASKAEIKKAYKEKSKFFHPDLNSDVNAIENFKAVQNAYETLSKIKEYEPFNDFEESWSEFFDDDLYKTNGDYFEKDIFKDSLFKGRNINSKLEISFLESFTGCKKTILIKKRDRCKDCNKGLLQCKDCRGSGLPKDKQSLYCNNCKGSGCVKCKSCTNGFYADNKEFSLEVTIPKGIENGTQIRLIKKGEESSARYGESGDVVVTVSVKEHYIFKRDKLDIVLDVPISYTQLVMGGDCLIPSLTAEKFSVKIPAGSQPSTKLRIKGNGFTVNNRQGDLIIALKLEVPKTLNEEYKDLINKLSKLEIDNLSPRIEKWKQTIEATNEEL